MLKDTFKKINSMIPNLFPVDAAKFNDPVALQTDWKQVFASRSGAASSTLVNKDENTLVYKSSIGGRIFGVVFILAGIFVLWISFMAENGQEGFVINVKQPWILWLVALVFALAGVFIIIQSVTPVAFDRAKGIYYRGRKFADPANVDGKHSLNFRDIHAIQLLTRLESTSQENGPSRVYRVYELNLVKHDAKRVHVTTYNQADRARRDAESIARLVKVPVWDGIEG